MRRLAFLVALCLLLTASCFLLPASAPQQAARPHRVLAFYYNWYGTPEMEKGAWQHWNECRGCRHDPQKTVEITAPRDGKKLTAPDTGTTNHPAKLYDSNDPAAIRQHLKLAEQAGIDALIVTWWGKGLYHDRAFRTALDVAAEAKSPVKFTIYYETTPRGAADPVAAVIDDFRYLRDQYAAHPSFFREDNKPVFFIYGRAMGQMKPAQWADAVAGIRSLGPAIIIADGLNARWLESFDGVHEYNPVGQILKKTDMAARYRNTVAMCQAQGRMSTATVLPGYDDSNIGRERSIQLDREKGELYRRLWQAALDAGPDWVIVTSFNEWHEGSEIEPSLEWGDLFINLTADYARKFKKGR
jgi:glycoprotein endo-alpha-1,2-mannosidase